MGAIEEILQRHPIWRGGAMARVADAVPTGFAGLDAALPGGGWPRQGLTELLADEVGIGELGLILPALAALTGAGHPSVPRLPAPCARARGARARRAHRQAPWRAPDGAALPAPEKTIPCFGSRCTSRGCRPGCSSRSPPGPASSRLGSRSSRRT